MSQDKLAKFMIVTKAWTPFKDWHCESGDLITVEESAFHDGSAKIHLGGRLRCVVMIDELLQHARIAEPDEFQKTLKHCPRCDRIEIEKGRWLSTPPCFKPRDGVVLVDETCPQCESKSADDERDRCRCFIGWNPDCPIHQDPDEDAL